MTEMEEIISRMQTGDEDAFNQMFEVYKDRIFRMAYLISGNYADSEDIAQETFIKCFCSCSKLREVSCFQSWLYQILTHTAIKVCKGKRREELVDNPFENEADSGKEQPLDAVIRKEEEQLIRKEIQRLDVKQRSVIVLYYYNQLSTKEIAKVMGCREGTVKSRLFTARKKLETVLEQLKVKEDPRWKEKKSILL